MKANELRIGNWVNVKDHGDVQLYEIACRNFDDELPGVNPIPLTEEWLVKFGFTVSEDTNSHNLKKAVISGFRINTYFDEEIGYWWLGYYHNKKNSHIKHVHQLQNLYFALTNEELVCH